jgi:thiamine-phosphate pyrophosphorylase
MHKYIPKVYYFINRFDLKELQTINNNIGIIYRNYDEKIDEKTLILIKNYCIKNNQKFYLSNNLKIAIKLKLDGLYIPSFNNKLNTKNYNYPYQFNIIGSAHNEIEIKIKENQGCNLIFLAPIFCVKKQNNYLGVFKFNKLSQNRKSKIIALGGINNNNIKKINLLNCYGFAGISWIKKNGLNKFRPFLNCLNRTN